MLRTTQNCKQVYGLAGQLPPPSCIYQHAKLYISCLFIQNFVFCFCSMLQIVFIDMLVSISGFNTEHPFLLKVSLAVVVKGKNHICFGSQCKSLLAFLSFWVIFISWVVLIFRVFFIFGIVFIFEPPSIFVIPFIFMSLSFMAS